MCESLSFFVDPTGFLLHAYGYLFHDNPAVRHTAHGGIAHPIYNKVYNFRQLRLHKGDRKTGSLKNTGQYLFPLFTPLIWRFWS